MSGSVAHSPPDEAAASQLSWSGIKAWWRRHFSHVGTFERWGYAAWGLVGLVVAIPEISAAAWQDGPWPTISGTIGHLEDLWDVSAIFVVALITVAAARALDYRRRSGNPRLFRALGGRTA